MKLNFEINNIAQNPLRNDFFVNITQETIIATGYDFLQDKNVSISMALVFEDDMQKLNKEYRKKDSVTDILSFCEYENIEEIRNVIEKEIFLGELILCYDDIEKYAIEKNIDLQKELVNVVSHGILHLLGFEHGKKMFDIQKQVVNNFKNI